MRHDEALLRTAIEKLRETEPEAALVTAASRRVADRLGIDLSHYPDIEAIESCGDVRQLLTAYRRGILSDARRLVIQAHLRDCGACQRYDRSGSERAPLDWSSPKAARGFAWRPRPTSWVGGSSHRLSRWWSSGCSSIEPSGKFRLGFEPRCNRSMALPIASRTQAIVNYLLATNCRRVSGFGQAGERMRFFAWRMDHRLRSMNEAFSELASEDAI